MKNLIGIFVIILIFGLGCSSNKKNNQIENQTSGILIDSTQIRKQLRFEKFLNKLPKYKLPIEIHCGFDSLESLNDFKDYMDYIPKSMEEIYGLVETDRPQYLVLYGRVGDVLYPFLYSYDKNGEIVDSLYLIITSCSIADETIIPNSYAIIDNTLQIIMTDTSKFIHYLDNENYVIDSTLITNIMTMIQENGHFQEIKKEIKQ